MTQTTKTALHHDGRSAVEYATPYEPISSLHSVKFPYPIEAIPKRARLEYEYWTFGQSQAAIRVTSSQDAEVAFLVHFEGGPACHRFSPPRSLVARAVLPTTIQILHHGGAYWWPMQDVDGRATTQYDIVDPAEFFDCLAAGSNDIFSLLPENVRLADVGPTPEFRTIAFDGHDVTLARVQRSLAENFLICDARLYVRGGQPVYVGARTDRYSRGTRVASAGPGRSVVRPDLLWAPGDQYDPLVEEAILEGYVWTADDRGTALTAAPGSAPVTHIEHVNRTAPIVRREHYIVDAVFRAALEMARERPWHHNLGGTLSLGIAESCDAETTRRRQKSLDAFYLLAVNERWLIPAAFRKRLERLSAEFPNPSIDLTSEEEASLWTI